jgi:hypothetical protein
MDSQDLEREFPLISKALMDELNRRFPHQSPQRNESIEDLRHRGGIRWLVDYLQTRFNEQEQRALNVQR